MWVTRLQVWCDIYSTQAVKKVAKSVEKAVKKGAVDISRPFKKCRKVSSESVGRSFFPIVAIVFFTEYYIYLKVSNNQGNIGSTKETLATETSVIDIRVGNRFQFWHVVVFHSTPFQHASHISIFIMTASG